MSFVVNKTRLPVTQWQTASGSVVSISDARKRYAKSLSVALEPIQDLHGYANPWVGGAGKNLVPLPSLDNGWVNGFIGGTGAINGGSRNEMTSFFVPASANTSYTISVTYSDTTPESAWIGFGAYDSEKTFIGRYADYRTTYTATTPQNTAYIRVTLRTFNLVQTLQCEKSSTATAFEPYENICPISGTSSVTAVRDGKNLLELYLERTSHQGINFNLTNDGKIHLEGTNTSSTASAFTGGNYSTYENCPWKFKAGKYKFSCTISDNIDSIGSVTFLLRKKKDNSMSQYNGKSQPVTVTVDDDFGAWFWISVKKSETVNTNVGVQLETGSIASAWEPYQGTSVTVQLGQTVYGGSLGVVSGVVTVTEALRTFGSNDLFRTWGVNNRKVGITGFYLYVSSPDISVFKICDSLPVNNAIWGGQNIGIWNNTTNPNSTYYMLCFDNSSLGILDTDSDQTAVDKLSAFLANSPVSVCYELATPQTIQLTAHQIEMLMRNNTVWSDAGVVTLNYARIHQ